MNLALARTPLAVLNVLFNPDLSGHVFRNLTPYELIFYTTVCRAAYCQVQGFWPRGYKIKELLEYFFGDAVGFRTLQAATDTLISGSSALQFVTRTWYANSDLDLYLYRRHVDQVTAWIIGEGYTFSPSDRQPPDLADAIVALESRYPRSASDEEIDPDVPYPTSSVATVFTFVKQVGEEERKVQCVVAEETPMEVIMSFHSTVVMNIISHDRVYVLYPMSTLRDRQSVVCIVSPNVTERAALAKYEARGYELVARPCRARARFHAGPRFVGDSMTWSVPLSPPLDLPATPGTADCCSWFMFLSPNALRYSILSMGCEVFTSSGLTLSYAVVCMKPVDYARATVLERCGVDLFVEEGDDASESDRGTGDGEASSSSMLQGSWSTPSRVVVRPEVVFCDAIREYYRSCAEGRAWMY